MISVKYHRHAHTDALLYIYRSEIQVNKVHYGFVCFFVVVVVFLGGGGVVCLFFLCLFCALVLVCFCFFFGGGVFVCLFVPWRFFCCFVLFLFF